MARIEEKIIVATIETVAFQGLEARPVEVQVHISKGLPAFTIVGLPDKAVAESRERVRAALTSIGLALPPRRVVVNLSPADLQKEGAHFDLPLALGLLIAMEVLQPESIGHFNAMGELGLDGKLIAVAGVLPAALSAHSRNKGLICPAQSGPEAALAGEMPILAPAHLLELINHFREGALLAPPAPLDIQTQTSTGDMRDIKGQESIKRAIEVIAAGGHNILMTGPPGVGKSMLAQRLPSLLPALEASEALEVYMIQSLSGLLEGKAPSPERPFRNPHHSASTPSLIGGGVKAKPGEVSLAHHGVLFLDELPEFSRQSLEALRQPIETGQAVIARARHHVTYPAKFQLVAAMNPCRCGWLSDSERACRKAPLCAEDYQAKISGPMMDRIDLHVETPALTVDDLTNASEGESSEKIAARIKKAHAIQRARYKDLPPGHKGQMPDCNARLDGVLLEKFAKPDEKGAALLARAVEQFKLTARGYHRILRIARTLADFDGGGAINATHIAEALSWRRVPPATKS